MTEKEIIRELMGLRGLTQSELAKRAGLRRQSNISSMLKDGGAGMRIDNVSLLVEALGGKIYIHDPITDKTWEVR